MSAAVLPFPLASRRAMIDKQARYAAELSPDAADRHIAYQCEIQRSAMRRKGIDEALITRETECMARAIRDALCKCAMAPGGRK